MSNIIDMESARANRDFIKGVEILCKQSDYAQIKLLKAVTESINILSQALKDASIEATKEDLQ
jgi:hypothetical protein